MRADNKQQLMLLVAVQYIMMLTMYWMRRMLPSSCFCAAAPASLAALRSAASRVDSSALASSARASLSDFDFTCASGTTKLTCTRVGQPTRLLTCAISEDHVMWAQQGTHDMTLSCDMIFAQAKSASCECLHNYQHLSGANTIATPV